MTLLKRKQVKKQVEDFENLEDLGNLHLTSHFQEGVSSVLDAVKKEKRSN